MRNPANEDEIARFLAEQEKSVDGRGDHEEQIANFLAGQERQESGAPPVRSGDAPHVAAPSTAARSRRKVIDAQRAALILVLLGLVSFGGRFALRAMRAVDRDERPVESTEGKIDDEELQMFIDRAGLQDAINDAAGTAGAPDTDASGDDIGFGMDDRFGRALADGPPADDSPIIDAAEKEPRQDPSTP